MKLFNKKSEQKASKSIITPMDKNQLNKIIGGATEGTPIGGIVVKGGKNPGGQTDSGPVVTTVIVKL